MKGVIALMCVLMACLSYGQLLRPDKMHLGVYNPETKHYEKPLLGMDGHDQQHHSKPLLGMDGHDQQHHGKALLGQDGHDQRPHNIQHMLGQDGHDLQHHGRHILGQDNHDFKKHGKKQLLGTDGHDLSHKEMFKAFVVKYNKTYESPTHYHHRHLIFTQNMKKVHILHHNEQGTATYGPTKFADLTEAEFRQQMLGFRPDLKPQHSNMKPVSTSGLNDMELPTSFDWREYGAVTPIKNQGMCGSCWAFSTTGNVEGQWAIKHKNLYSLSEQELVDCDSTDQGCNGGLPENAYEAIAKLGGLESEQDYPYDGEDEQCHFNKSMVQVTVNGSLELPEDEIMLAKWLVKNGPISIGINANALQFYMGGVSHPFKFLCNPADLDHGMLIVGFGVHTTKYLHRRQPYWLVKNSWAYPVFKKTLPFWIVKNSWGEQWGEQGYYRVYRGDGTCGVNKMATSCIVP
ncbi:hypothetical protein Pcinc_007389 [Petrolisthes cinctipes]|uniref:Uncharacterized protein n=1 Tax=Petrolisthes cinctipes TaxID=88211 RepID=A0AAE1G9D3_PETCI|nr:hypothetical protein Pcinc_007389 [Petrolisthes cinctipes]